MYYIIVILSSFKENFSASVISEAIFQTLEQIIPTAEVQSEITKLGLDNIKSPLLNFTKLWGVNEVSNAQCLFLGKGW